MIVVFGSFSLQRMLDMWLSMCKTKAYIYIYIYRGILVWIDKKHIKTDLKTDNSITKSQFYSDQIANLTSQVKICFAHGQSNALTYQYGFCWMNA